MDRSDSGPYHLVCTWTGTSTGTYLRVNCPKITKTLVHMYSISGGNLKKVQESRWYFRIFAKV
jgi:hypothetical protein